VIIPETLEPNDPATTDPQGSIGGQNLTFTAPDGTIACAIDVSGAPVDLRISGSGDGGRHRLSEGEHRFAIRSGRRLIFGSAAEADVTVLWLTAAS